jgi:hypothetical protein
MKYKMNEAMQKYLERTFVDTSDYVTDVIGDEIAPLFEGGLRLIDGVVTTSWFWEHRGNASIANCYDETGLECTVNLLHLDDLFPSKFWVSAINAIGNLLERDSLSYRLRLIATIDDMTCTTRFHLLRSGQVWLASELDSYPTPVMYRDYDHGVEPMK